MRENEKIIFVVLFLLITINPVGNTIARSINPTENTLEVFGHHELSIKQAIDLAYPSALKWNKTLNYYRELI